MTVTSTEIFIYITALIILFITPGPVWIAIIARTISGGAKSGLSLVSGVCLGDMLWPVVVFLGIGFILSVYADFLIIFRVLCSIILAIMGIQIVINYKKTINNNFDLLIFGEGEEKEKLKELINEKNMSEKIFLK